METVKLNNGVAMPLLGLGVWSSKPGRETQDAVLHALKTGYRHIDTAAGYKNEADVGAAIARSGLRRSDVFITTKLAKDQMGYEQTHAAFEHSRQLLGVEQIDLYLMHWPSVGTRKESWRAMEEIHRQGRCRAIGVSNFTIRHLEELAGYAGVQPATNQVEYNVFCYQRELRDYCRARGIVLTAYSPLARADKIAHPDIVRISGKHGRSPAQIMIRWVLEQGIPTFPKSVRPERIEENFRVFDFRLDDDDRRALDRLDEGYRCNPNWNPELEA